MSLGPEKAAEDEAEKEKPPPAGDEGIVDKEAGTLRDAGDVEDVEEEGGGDEDGGGKAQAEEGESPPPPPPQPVEA